LNQASSNLVLVTNQQERGWMGRFGAERGFIVHFHTIYINLDYLLANDKTLMV
jgi:hypothetical protein